jgi:hypothetical protein
MLSLFSSHRQYRLPHPTSLQHQRRVGLFKVRFGIMASVKRKLPDGSVVMVYDGDGLPRFATRGKIECKSCLRTFNNHGGLAVHVRFHHPSDEAAMNRLHSRTTSTTTKRFNTPKKNTISTTVTSTLSSEVVNDDGEVDAKEPKKKKKKTVGAAARKRYTWQEVGICCFLISFVCLRHLPLCFLLDYVHVCDE